MFIENPYCLHLVPLGSSVNKQIIQTANTIYIEYSILVTHYPNSKVNPMVDDNIDDLKRMVAELKKRLEEAIEDGIIDNQENEDIMVKIKEIEICILNDFIITKKERALMKEAQDLLESYLAKAEMRLDK